MEPDFVCKAFVTMLAIKDSDHVARVNAFTLGRKCWPLEPEVAEQRAIEALKILMAPDTKRLEPQLYEGRRLEKVEDGYKILNGQYYEDMMRKLGRKVYKARKAREYRSRETPTTTTMQERIAHEAHANGDDKTFNEAVTRSLPDKCKSVNIKPL